MWWVAVGDVEERDRARAIAEFESLRTAKFDEAWRRLEGGTFLKEEWEALRGDLARRWEQWNAVGRRFGADVLWIRLHRPYSAVGGDAGAAAIVWLPVMLCCVAVCRLLGATPNMRLARAIRRGRCPSCGYDVVRTADAFARPSEGLVRPGPRVCPECGLGWPCLPPHLGAAWRSDSAPQDRGRQAPGDITRARTTP